MYPVIAFLLLASVVSARLENVGIIGGDDVTSTSQAPWQVSLQVSGSHFCGGTLISKTHVMSAGHCKITGALTRTTVALEGLDYTNLAQSFRASAWEVHPDFTQNLIINYDYSVITLDGEVTIKSGVVEAITLPASGQEFTGMATITGWGKIAGNNDVLPTTLQIATVPLLSTADCAAIWGTLRVTPQSQCVGGSGTGGCNGDSGGPLVQQVGGTWYLIGNTSWGASSCDATAYPTVYSKNSAEITWITNQM